MILSFNIEYRTNWGEEVRISGLFPESIPLHTTDGIYWTAEVELEIPHEGMIINYNYQIEQNGIVIRREWDSFPRSIFLSGTSKKIYRINDCWKNIPEQSYLYSSAFTEALLAHPERESIPQSYKKGLVIKAYAPHINKDYCLAICGNQKSLGHWAELLDVKFNADGTAEDLSAMKMPIKTFAGPTLTMIENETFGYIAKFDPETVNQNKITSGFYTVDFTQNISFQNAIADGFSMELYVTAKDYGEKSAPIPMGCHGGGGVAFIWHDDNNSWSFEPYIGNYSACNMPPLGEVPEETWYHVVGVWDGTGNADAIKLYVDGKVEAQRAPASGNSFQFPGNKWFVIGGDAGAANEADRAYKGQIAITRIYDRALTAEEVKALYNTLKE